MHKNRYPILGKSNYTGRLPLVASVNRDTDQKWQNRQMQGNFTQDKTFDPDGLPIKGEYENCIFNYCNFANRVLSEFKFIDCTFNGCNFSLVELNKKAFQDVKFKDCKMLGPRFDNCNLAQAIFDHTALEKPTFGLPTIIPLPRKLTELTKQNFLFSAFQDY